MISGVLYALLAGMMWGLIFVGPLIVPEYPAILQSTGRYLALGLIALPLAWLGRARLRQLSRQDWRTDSNAQGVDGHQQSGGGQRDRKLVSNGGNQSHDNKFGRANCKGTDRQGK